MKRILIFITVVGFAINANAQTKSATKKTAAVTKKSTAVKPAMKTLLDSASYAFGQMMAGNLKSGGLTGLNYDLMTLGLKDAFSGSAALMPQQACQESINKLFEGLNAKQNEVNKQKYAGNIKEGEAFLAQNKAKAGIKTTASGLQYEVITQGSGKMPKATDQVTVHYKGTLLNGKQFDSSYDRGEPATFGLNQVIKGWTEGVQLMNEGSKFRFFIPYNLAYGERGAGENIPPYSALIFEVELIKVAGE